MSNIDDFNEATAKILAKLYETFPIPQTLYVSELSGESEEIKSRVYGTIIFLQREGIISYESRVATDSFHGVLLTGKGFTILNSVPEALQEKVSIGTMIITSVKNGSKMIIQTVVEELIKNAISR